MRLIHTADWQIGKVFKQFGGKEESLRQARLDAIESIGRLAVSEGAAHVLVAGDVYDTETPTEATLRGPLERMKQFSQVQWHLLPGNHDPHKPAGLWERVGRTGTPANVHFELSSKPTPLGGEAMLLPAPLLRKTEATDLSAWMDTADTQSGLIRIGLAHGSITGFGGEGEATNPIDPERPAKARLDYMALGDWHGTKQIGPAIWYSGTPEPDRAGGQEQGTALVVDIAGAGAVPAVRPVIVGTYRWVTRDEVLSDGSETDDIITRLRAFESLSRLIMRVRLTGTITLAARAALENELQSLEAAICHLDVDRNGLHIRPTPADLESIDFDGVLRRAADKLMGQVEDVGLGPVERRCAEDALVQLYLLVVKPMEVA